MSAKAKALQAMVVVGISAITYTVYQSATRNDIKPERVSILAKNEKAKKDRKATTAVEALPDAKSNNNLPGYSDPDQSVR